MPKTETKRAEELQPGDRTTDGLTVAKVEKLVDGVLVSFVHDSIVPALPQKLHPWAPVEIFARPSNGGGQS